VVLNVTVLDARKRPVVGLGSEDFAVYENGVQQDVVFFGLAEVPIDLALLLDLSSSMTETITLVRKAAAGFLRTLREHDRATVIGFANRLQILQPLTDNMERLERAIQQAQPHGSTALYDAVYITLKELERERKRATDVRRQVLVVLSDGHDTVSISSAEDALAAVHRSGVTVYTVALKEPATASGSPSISQSAFESDFTLKALARDSGGRAFSVDTIAQLPGVYDAIAAEVAHQYVLGYIPRVRQADRTFQQVRVQLSSRGSVQEVRTRRGYYAAGQ
jgi:Ca-activated chloride channel family protein